MILFFSLFSFFYINAAKASMDVESFVEYQAGETNIILSVPHGGKSSLDEIPDRVQCCRSVEDPDQECFTAGEGRRCKVILYNDLQTIPMARIIGNDLEARGKKPHLVINHMKRIKVDVNRHEDEAAQGDPIATQVYRLYHQTLESIKQKLDTGVLFDLHGQSHKHHMTEFGYLKTPSQLNFKNYEASNSSLRYLSSRTNLTGEELMIGPNSLGSFLEEKGFASIPSPDHPVPGLNRYYAGGYITRYHGSLYGGTIDAVQIEMPKNVRLTDDPNFQRNYSLAISDSIDRFHSLYYVD